MALVVLFFMAALLIVITCYSQKTNLSLGQYKNTLIAGIGLLVLAYLLPVTAFNNDIDDIKKLIGDFFEVDLN